MTEKIKEYARAEAYNKYAKMKDIYDSMSDEEKLLIELDEYEKHDIYFDINTVYVKLAYMIIK